MLAPEQGLGRWLDKMEWLTYKARASSGPTWRPSRLRGADREKQSHRCLPDAVPRATRNFNNDMQ